MTVFSRRLRFLPTTAFLALSAAAPAAFACDADSPYMGTVCAVAFDYCPSGFLPADGRTLPISQYTALYSLLGIRYGGDGRVTFGLPDLRGRMPIGVGQGPGLVNINLAQRVGQQQLTLAPTQVPLVAHTHAATFTPVMGQQQVGIPATTGNLSVTANLPVGTTVGDITGAMSALSNGQSGYLAGLSASSSGPIQPTVKGPYNTSAPVSGASANLPAVVQVSGNASTAANTVTVDTVTGGAVAIAPSATAATNTVSTQSPALGMTMCIVANGIYPPRP